MIAIRNCNCVQGRNEHPNVEPRLASLISGLHFAANFKQCACAPQWRHETGCAMLGWQSPMTSKLIGDDRTRSRTLNGLSTFIHPRGQHTQLSQTLGTGPVVPLGAPTSATTVAACRATIERRAHHPHLRHPDKHFSMPWLILKACACITSVPL